MAELVAAVPGPLLAALAGVYAVLLAATGLVAVLARRPGGAPELKARPRSWWWIVLPVSLALVTGPVAVAILFALTSFVALREFLSIIPVRPADRMAILIAYLAIPLQYWFVADDWYGMFAIFIPVYVTAAIALRLVLAGETAGFIRSAGTLQWGLFLTLYNLSHLAFLMVLDVAVPLPAGGAGLLLFVLAVVAFNDVAQFVTGRMFGRHAIAPAVSPKKTWEGFLGGLAASAALGAGLAALLTPFGALEGALAATGLAGLGFLGDVTVSAVKRDLGIKDSGSLLPGHGGILDRLDSLVFAAPVFLHYVRYVYGA